jgi:hypothetical protein
VRVRLEHVRVGGKIFTSAEALQNFFRSLAEADAAYFRDPPAPTTPENPISPTAEQRQHSMDRALAKLDAAGI